MNKTTLLSYFAFFLITSFAFSQNDQFEYKSRPREFEKYEYRNDSVFQLKTPTSTLNYRNFESKIPYPIIFIHGLNSSSETWNSSSDYYDSQYAFTFGGRFDFCLNADDNNTTTNKNFYPTPDADIAAFESLITNGDYYYVNFNVNPDGAVGTNVLSNQAAVAKQGIALKKAIERILSITGKDKVILVGHSMGGLASREYVQNESNWQADNKHHIAKILTLGTPHGGSNASDNSLTFLTGTDIRSEAIRDLKTNYYYSREGSRYLFGGVEIQDNDNMNDNNSTPDFYNVDINCNEIIGETIVGLNEKPIDNLIDFSCVIGRITGGTTDGVVAEPSSNFNNYYPTLTYPAKLFYFTSTLNLIQNHTELTGLTYQMMQGLDEPNVKELAYEINTNKNYIGYTTVQNPVAPDNDFFKFTVAENVEALVSISSIVTSTMNATLINAAGSAIGVVENNTGNTLTFNRVLNPGDYFLKITSEDPTNTNYETPYQFSITTTLSAESNLFDAFVFYPNPVLDLLHLDNISLTKASVFSVLGHLIAEKTFESSTSNVFDLTNLEKGIYLIVLENETQQKTIKVVKQ
ncbi:alpha/beta fold hydrolase [Flavobacterium ardleyense]|uniref:Alpha/beta fold hydrolase n=1 Tax=Flavobacterium ardleyense TaxID=2038737 RepID=A0ABW5ZAE0_9FLAO